MAVVVLFAAAAAAALRPINLAVLVSSVSSSLLLPSTNLSPDTDK